MTRPSPLKCWAVIPAAGVGRRMQADIPKQYLTLGDNTVLEQTVHRLARVTEVHALVVAVADDDPWWPKQRFDTQQPVYRASGGTERCHSVLNGLSCLLEQGAHEDDWVLVHDAARPCVRVQDVERLIATVTAHNTGGLLAMPVRDTMKQADNAQCVVKTIDRDRLWHALTPQMFRLGELQQALTNAIDKGLLVTDESSAMEQAGHRPLLVEGSSDNIKITHPEDLSLAAFYLQQQEQKRFDEIDDGE